LIENYDDFSDTVIIGIQPRGVPLAERLAALIKKETGVDVQTGKLDITFHRDDFRTREKPLVASESDIEFMLDDKHVLLVDDVLYTGRSVRAAMDAMMTFGRPEDVKLLVLIDRRFDREVPIQADYFGSRVDTIDESKVLVKWKELDGEEYVHLLKNQDA
jgi:pyrimidine operon attenuation protein/uracil phosphoribosyltransferase